MNAVLRRSALHRSATVVMLMLGAVLIVGGGACGHSNRPPQTTVKPQKKDTVASVPRAMATRAELEALAAGKSGRVSDQEIKVIRDRLAHGDLQPGDRIALRVLGEQALTDTFTVKPTGGILLPNLGEVPLQGVLRSELNDRLRREIGRFVRNPQLEATALVRVSMLGAVGKPGFYNLPADVLATDAIMAAGGPAKNGDLSKTEIRRGGLLVASKEETGQALQGGASLDQLNVQSGDEITIGTAGSGVRGVLQTMGLISGALFGIVAFSRIL